MRVQTNAKKAEASRNREPRVALAHVLVALSFPIIVSFMVVSPVTNAIAEKFLPIAAFLALCLVGLRLFRPQHAMICVSAACVALVYLFSFLTFPTSQAIVITASTIVVVSVIVFHVIFGASLLASGFYRAATIFVSLLTILLSINSGMSKNVSAGIAIYGTMMLYHPLIWKAERKRAFVLVLAASAQGLMISFILEFRAMVVFSLLTLLSYLFAMVTPRLIFRNATLAAMIFGGLIVVWFYLNVNSIGSVAFLNDWLFRTTGRTALSGREVIWPIIADAIQIKPYWGWGAGTLPHDIYPTSYSSHNFYLQLLLQVGVFGFLPLCVFLLSIWRVVNLENYKSQYTKFSSSVFVLMVLHNCTEVNMMQNQLPSSIQAWIVISCGVSVAHYFSRPHERIIN